MVSSSRMDVQRSHLAPLHAVIEQEERATRLLCGRLPREGAAAGEPHLLALAVLADDRNCRAHLGALPLDGTEVSIWTVRYHEGHVNLVRAHRSNDPEGAHAQRSRRRCTRAPRGRRPPDGRAGRRSRRDLADDRIPLLQEPARADPRQLSRARGAVAPGREGAGRSGRAAGGGRRAPRAPDDRARARAARPAAARRSTPRASRRTARCAPAGRSAGSRTRLPRCAIASPTRSSAGSCSRSARAAASRR